MARHALVVIAGTPHHVTQRGNRRQRTYFSDAEYLTYLDNARETFPAAGVRVGGYCLMPNHVHLIAMPERSEALAQAVGATLASGGPDTCGRGGSRRFRWTRTMCASARGTSGSIP